jgi:alkyl sulfatase BDS1-like metallo-beta-lactamase superfamily hydrolase
MVETYKNKFNKKFRQPKDKSNSIQDISKLTGYKLSGLKTIFNKGVGAYRTNPASVRPSVKSPEQWAMARIYSAVMGGKASKIDAKHLVKST